MLRQKANPLLSQYLGLQVRRVRIAGQRSGETDGSIVDSLAMPQVRFDMPLDMSAGGTESLAQCRWC